jgi:hypothetical protein
MENYSGNLLACHGYRQTKYPVIKKKKRKFTPERNKIK